MKKLFVFICVMLFLQNMVFAEKKPIELKSTKDQNEQTQIFRSIIINVTGFYDTGTGEVTLYFHRPIGKATISLTTETGSSIVFTQTIDTDTEEALEFALPEQNGVYMLSIVSDTYEGVGKIVF